MYQECLDAISSVAGFGLTDKQGEEVYRSLVEEMDRISARDPSGWDSLTHDEQVRSAAASLAKRLKHEAGRKKANLLRQAIANNENIREWNRLAKDEDVHSYNAVARILLRAEKRTKGVKNQYMTRLLDTVNGIGTKWLGLVEDAADVRDFVREVFGEKTGNERAAKSAKAWLETVETMRQRAVKAGYAIRKLDYGYIPQSHDRWRIRKAGREEWIKEVMPLLDRKRYRSAGGFEMSDYTLRELLNDVYDGIVTSGNTEDSLFDAAKAINMPPTADLKPGRKFEWARRQLHFRDADSFLAYEARFGQGSLTNALVNHVGKLSNDIALLETLGPKADAAYMWLKRLAEAEAMNARKTESRTRLLMKYSDWQGFTGVHVDDIWANLTGAADHTAPNHEGVAAFMSGWRALETAGKLGKAFISALSDIPSYFIATGFNRLDFTEGLMFLFRIWGLGSGGREWRDYANRAGFIADSITSTMSRWGSDNIGQGWTTKLSNATMRASLLTQFTDTVRQAFCLNMSAGLAKMKKKSWAELDSYDRARLEQGGITEHEWRMIRAAETENFRGTEFLPVRQLQKLTIDRLGEGFTQAEIDALPSKYLGFIVSESEMASLGPDVITRTEANRGLQRGTAGGELMRSIALFKSFPLAMMEKHFRRADFLWHNGTHVDQLAYAASILVATTVFGAISVQVQNLLNGKDPEDMGTLDFWAKSMSKAGGMGYLSDIITYGLSEDSRYGAMSGLANIAGPVVSTAIDAADLMKAAIGKGIYDRDTKAGAKAVRLIRGHMPFVNMWYTSAAIDRAVMNEINEYLSPGYMKNTRNRLKRGTGQGFWLGQDSLIPERAPRFATKPQ